MEWKISDTNELDIYSEKIIEMYENSYRKIGLIDFGGWHRLKNYLNCSCYLLIDTTRELNGIILYSYYSEIFNADSSIANLSCLFKRRGSGDQPYSNLIDLA